MKAMVSHSPGASLLLSEVPAPTPGADEVLVRVKAVGLCATDLKARDGALPSVEFPRILGHEIAGEVAEEKGGFAVGTPVACHIYDTCGQCRFCRGGRPTLCRQATRYGIERDGGLAEYLVAPLASLIPIPEGVSYPQAAVAMDSVATIWSALEGRIEKGDRVLIVGAGGLGLSAIQLASTMNGKVAVFDQVESKLSLSRELGAELAVGPGGEATVLDWSDGGVDLALEVSGSREGFVFGTDVLRPGGQVVCCGYKPGAEYGLDSARLVLNEFSIVGSRAATKAQATAAVASVGRGEIRPTIHESVPLDATNEALELLAQGRVVGRIVVSFE